MKLKTMNFVMVLTVAALCALPAMAADKGSVAVELKGQKVVKEANGKEKLESAEKAKPGDVIEYRAVYRNKGKHPATNVQATIPVPLGTEYLPGSAKPAKVLASADGKEYAPVPLKRAVSLPSGKQETREVPVAEYRFIRWDLKTLTPGQSATVGMRVKLSTNAAP